MSVITIERKVLEKNDELAQRNRRLFQDRGIFVLNLVSSPGSGKTSILEKTCEALRGSMNIAVIEGDVQTDLDAQRVAAYGVAVVQIVTMGGCHLDVSRPERSRRCARAIQRTPRELQTRGRQLDRECLCLA